jgi:hypothetical protein
MKAIFSSILVFFFISQTLLGLEFDYKKTHGLVVGVLQWKDPNLSTFSTENRKDAELYHLLKNRGANLHLLLDNQASQKMILKKLQEIAKATPEDGVFLFYYAGHGVKRDSSVYIANSDINTESAEKTGVSMDKVIETISKNFRGKTIILSGDFCYSGAFLKAAQNWEAQGKNAIVLTSASSSNQSTGNWTYTQTLIDCFSGSPFCDQNDDGEINWSEMSLEVQNAMKYRESQLSGNSSFLDFDDLVIAKPSQRKSENSGEYVRAPYNGEPHIARVLSRSNESIELEFFFYSDKVVSKLSPSEVQPLEYKSFPPGSKVKVLWNGTPYEAEILDVKEDFHYITYIGYDSSWDEWVLADRILEE